MSGRRLVKTLAGNRVSSVTRRAKHAVIELASQLQLLLYVSLIACLFAPWGMAAPGSGFGALALGVGVYLGKLAVGAFLLALFETSIAKMRVFRVPEFLGAALMLGLLATLLLCVSRSL